MHASTYMRGKFSKNLSVRKFFLNKCTFVFDSKDVPYCYQKSIYCIPIGNDMIALHFSKREAKEADGWYGSGSVVLFSINEKRRKGLTQLYILPQLPQKNQHYQLLFPVREIIFSFYGQWLSFRSCTSLICLCV